MYQSKDDIVNKVEVKNEFSDGTEEFNIMNENFLPSLVISANS